VFLGGVAVIDESLQPLPVRGRECDRNAGAHAPDSHTPRRPGIPSGIQMSGSIH
jgi:hypothetical protein